MESKRHSTLVLVLTLALMSSLSYAENDLTQVTYDKLTIYSVEEAYQTSDGENFLVAGAQYKTLILTIDSGDLKISAASDIAFGTLALCLRFAFDEDEQNFYVVANKQNTMYILKFNSKRVLLQTYQIIPRYNSSSLPCGYLDLNGTTLTWYSGNVAYIMDTMNGEGLEHTETRTWSGKGMNSVSISGWVPTPQGGFFGYGGSTQSSDFLFFPGENFGVDQVWVFSDIITVINSVTPITGLPGVYVMVASVGYSKQLIVIFTVSYRGPELLSTWEVESPIQGTYEVASPAEKMFVLYSGPEVMLFEGQTGNEFVNTWSSHFSSYGYAYDTQTFLTGGSETLTMVAIIQESDRAFQANGGFVQLVEIDRKSGQICDCPSDVKRERSSVTLKEYKGLTTTNQSDLLQAGTNDPLMWTVSQSKNFSVIPVSMQSTDFV